MRCDCCNTVLTDMEACITHGVTGEYLNTCKKCLKGLGIPYKEKQELRSKRDDYFDDMVEVLDEGPQTMFWDDED